jgi:hypothetical protein
VISPPTPSNFHEIINPKYTPIGKNKNQMNSNFVNINPSFPNICPNKITDINNKLRILQDLAIHLIKLTRVVLYLMFLS